MGFHIQSFRRYERTGLKAGLSILQSLVNDDYDPAAHLEAIRGGE